MSFMNVCETEEFSHESWSQIQVYLTSYPLTGEIFRQLTHQQEEMFDRN